MKTSPQEAARNAPDGEALFRALEMTPAQVTAVEQGEQAGKRRGRVKLFSRHQPRHAVPPEHAETDEDAETTAMEFRGMKTMEDIEAALESGGALKYDPSSPKRTGPQPGRATGPQPRFTPNSQTGPQRIPRHASSETDRILDIARRRADAVPVPEPPVTRPVTAAQAADHIARLRKPGCCATDGYGNVPAHIAYMRRVDHLTGTTTRYVFPAAWPLPVAPYVPQARDVHDLPVAVTAGTPLGEPMPGCWSLNAETGEKCGNAMPPPHGDHPHIGPSGDEWTDESGTYCGGDADCACWDHRRVAGNEAAS